MDFDLKRRPYFSHYHPKNLQLHCVSFIIWEEYCEKSDIFVGLKSFQIVSEVEKVNTEIAQSRTRGIFIWDTPYSIYSIVSQ